MNKVEFAGFERGHNGMLAVRFNVFAKAGYVAAVATSAPVFRSYGAAIKGARRAVAAVQATGALPNMCERF
jgi:hypothetical protein